MARLVTIKKSGRVPNILRHTANDVLITDANRIVAKFRARATLYMKDAVGLAGNQVGMKENIFMAKVLPYSHYTRPFKIFVNATTVSVSLYESGNFVESCLSIPGQSYNVVRPNEITIRYLDYAGMVEVEETYSGLDARIIQHEMDHLAGVLISDKEKEYNSEK